MLELLYEHYLKDTLSEKEPHIQVASKNLNECLTGNIQDKELLDDIRDWIELYADLKCKDGFSQGFKCAIKIMIECYPESNIANLF